jgi:hypothetical protein
MFTWLYDLLVSFVYFVLGLFGIQWSQDQPQLESQTPLEATGLDAKELVVEPLPCHEYAL